MVGGAAAKDVRKQRLSILDRMTECTDCAVGGKDINRSSKNRSSSSSSSGGSSSSSSSSAKTTRHNIAKNQQASCPTPSPSRLDDAMSELVTQHADGMT